MKLVFLIYLFSLNLCLDADCQKAIPITTSSIEAKDLYLKGFKLEDNGELASAKDYYKKAIEKDTSFALAYMAIALLQTEYAERKKLMAKAVSLINNVSEGERLWIAGRNAFYGDGKREEELSFFEKLSALYPEDPVAQYLVGYMNHHHGRNDIQKAIKHLEKAIKIDPLFITAYNDLGNAYMEAKDFKNAERIFIHYIKLQPDKAKPVEKYAEMLMRKGEYNRSIIMYRKALVLDPNYPWTYFGLAANLNFKGKHTEARSILPAVSLLKLSERETYHIMHAYVCSYVDEGKFDSAIISLQEHERIGKDKNYFTQRYLALNNITRLYFEQGNAVKGMEVYTNFRNMIQAESKNDNLKRQVADMELFYKAWSSYINNENSKALQLISDYNKLRGTGDEQSRLLTAKIMLKLKQPVEAINILKQNNQDNQYVQFWMANAYKINGETAKAHTIFKNIAERNEMQELDYHLVRKKAIAESMKN
jgi:tetratricopeptide (TPR) repeat protein